MIENIKKIKNPKSTNFFLVAGPCVVEDLKMPFSIAEKLIEITDRLDIPFIFKASYKKANRTRPDSFTGIGDVAALKLLGKLAKEMDVPVITDIHSTAEAAIASEYVDLLQIPAFLCRQTDILQTAAMTGLPVNIKKGQFMSAGSMKHAVDKVKEAGNEMVMLTERGNMFGYGDLVVDYRNIVEMKQTGVPVILDCTHSLQQPNTGSGVTGGRPGLIETIAKAGIATGVDGIFIETHPNPSRAKSDGANMLPLDSLESLLTKLIRIREAIKS